MITANQIINIEESIYGVFLEQSYIKATFKFKDYPNKIQDWLKQIKKSVNPWESFLDVNLDKSKKLVTITPVVNALPPSLGGILLDLDKKFAKEVGVKKLY